MGELFYFILEFLKNLWNKPTDEGVNPSRIENNKKTTSLTSKRPKEQLLAIFMWGVKMVRNYVKIFKTDHPLLN